MGINYACFRTRRNPLPFNDKWEYDVWDRDLNVHEVFQGFWAFEQLQLAFVTRWMCVKNVWNFHCLKQHDLNKGGNSSDCDIGHTEHSGGILALILLPGKVRKLDAVLVNNNILGVLWCRYLLLCTVGFVNVMGNIFVLVVIQSVGIDLAFIGFESGAILRDVKTAINGELWTDVNSQGHVFRYHV